MSDTNTNTGNVLQMPTGSQVYDGLMAKIEPELLTANLPHLDEKYVSETPAQRAERYKRYSNAFAAYDEAFKKWMSELSQSVQAFRRTAMRSAEQQSRGEEQSTLQSLEAQIEAAQLSPSA